MKKRIIWLLLLILCLSIAALPAAAIFDVSLTDGMGLPMRLDASSGEYVFDGAAILTRSEREQLEQAAAEVSETYGCGVYIVTVYDYLVYTDGYSIESAAENLYDELELGMGRGADGILLLLSMSGRDYDLAAYGYGNTAFTDYGKDILAGKFKDDFSGDHWYAGLSDYIDFCAEMLRRAADGKPVDVGTYRQPLRERLGLLQKVIFIIIIPCVIAFFACSSMKRKMKSVAKAANARFYAIPNSLNLYESSDNFTHITETRVLIDNDSDRGGGGGTSVGDSGFSHSSGKF